MSNPWPTGFERIPDEAWTQAPLDDLALNYDTVENHGWYANLDPTVEELAELLPEGGLLVDYSGGTGLLIQRLLRRVGDRRVGVVNVDSSAKFLRLSLEKFREDDRVAFRRIRYLKDEQRLQLVTEVLDQALLERGVDALSSTNAIHLYYDLDDTLRSWHRVLRPGGRVLVQSGNIARDDRANARWIIDDTVHAVHAAARAIVAEDDRYAAYRGALRDADRLAEHDRYRAKVFLPPRPLEHYVGALRDAGFEVLRVEHRAIPVHAKDWLEFLSVYHDAIVGWVGGSEKVEGEAPSEEAVRDRERLMREALDRVLDGKDGFEAEWTYVTCERP